MKVRSFGVIDGRVACPYRGDVDVEACYRCRRLRAFYDEESGTRVVCIAPLRSLVSRQHSKGGTVKVEDVMTKDVITVRPDTPLKTVARQLVEHAISGLPVVNEAGEVVGVISEADLLVKESGSRPKPTGRIASLLHPPSAGAQAKLDARLAEEAMTAPPITIAPFLSTSAAADEMLRSGINRLPVVRNGQLVGIVTRADLVRAFARSDEQVEREVRVQAEYFLHLAEDFSQVDVSSTGGEVKLTGRVRRRENAEELPRFLSRVPGVVGVVSELTWLEDGSRAARV